MVLGQLALAMIFMSESSNDLDLFVLSVEMRGQCGKWPIPCGRWHELIYAISLMLQNKERINDH